MVRFEVSIFKFIEYPHGVYYKSIKNVAWEGYIECRVYQHSVVTDNKADEGPHKHDCFEETALEGDNMNVDASVERDDED